jgi:hypothetical protein
MLPTTENTPEPPSPKHWPCERCRHWVLPRRAHWGWRAGEIGFWLFVPIALFVLKGAGVVAMPLILLFVGGLAGPLREKASADPRCPLCRCYLPASRVPTKLS